MKGSRLLGLSMIALLLGLVVPLRTTSAALVDLTLKDSGSETVVFQDDFNDNGNNWSHIDAVPGTNGTATIGADPGGTGQTVWYPTNQVNNIVASDITFTDAIQLNATQHQINLYMRVRDANPTGGNAANFYFRLLDVAGFSYGGEIIELPGTSTQILSRNLSGATQTATGAGVNAGSATTFMNYRLQMDFVAGSPDTMTLTASYYNGTSYVNLVTQSPAKLVGGTPSTEGQFKYIQIYSRNAGSTTVNDGAYFDAVAITVVPEPATVCLLGSAAAGLFLRRRRQRA